MKIPWTKILNIGRVAAGFVPGGERVLQAIEMAVDAVEDNYKDLGPGNSEAKRLEAIRKLQEELLPAIETGVGKDLLNDAALVEARDQFIAAYVSAQHARASFLAALARAKSAKNKTPIAPELEA